MVQSVGREIDTLAIVTAYLEGKKTFLAGRRLNQPAPPMTNQSLPRVVRAVL